MLILFAIAFHFSAIVICLDSFRRSGGGGHGFVRMLLVIVNVIFLLLCLLDLATQIGVIAGE